MHAISKYLWGGLLLLCAALIAVWWAQQQGSTKQPSPELTMPDIDLPKPSNPLPNTLTYYRWTDGDGNTGYSKELPEQVSSYKVIVLNARETSINFTQNP